MIISGCCAHAVYLVPESHADHRGPRFDYSSVTIRKGSEGGENGGTRRARRANLTQDEERPSKDVNVATSPSSPIGVFAKLSLTSPILRRFDDVFIDLRFARQLLQYDQCSRGDVENKLVRCRTERCKGPSVHFTSTATNLSPPGPPLLPLKSLSISHSKTLEMLLKADTRRTVSN
ncbi:hypothetical protein EDD85DRAFT_843760 [Armillaria nabsnona]|nr:hypothetical protein EDD85DRAFT_843760 [Armillaria nabsnona]